tara:strand:- start:318 stop:500 length:183 start_codon:yes stop_codon:yes gene_type:complete
MTHGITTKEKILLAMIQVENLIKLCSNNSSKAMLYSHLFSIQNELNAQLTDMNKDSKIEE